MYKSAAHKLRRLTEYALGIYWVTVWTAVDSQTQRNCRISQDHRDRTAGLCVSFVLWTVVKSMLPSPQSQTPTWQPTWHYIGTPKTQTSNTIYRLYRHKLTSHNYWLWSLLTSLKSNPLIRWRILLNLRIVHMCSTAFTSYPFPENNAPSILPISFAVCSTLALQVAYCLFMLRQN